MDDNTQQPSGDHPGNPLQPSQPGFMPSSQPGAMPPESALRTTQNTEGLTNNSGLPQHVAGSLQAAPVPRARHRRSPREMPPPPPPSLTSAPPTPPVFTNAPIGQIAAITQPRASPTLIDQQDDLHVDTNYGNDAVYMLNSSKDSWSRHFPEDAVNHEYDDKLDAQAIFAISKIEKAQRLAEEQGTPQIEQPTAESTAVGPSPNESTVDEPPVAEPSNTEGIAAESTSIKAPASGTASPLSTTAPSLTPEERALLQQDVILRNLSRRLETQINSGAKVMVERMLPINSRTTCKYPLCQRPGGLIAPGVNYAHIGRDDEQGGRTDFCLGCLQRLWGGVGMLQGQDGC